VEKFDKIRFEPKGRAKSEFLNILKCFITGSDFIHLWVIKVLLNLKKPTMSLNLRSTISLNSPQGSVDCLQPDKIAIETTEGEVTQ
jgi:hypothetical protein